MAADIKKIISNLVEFLDISGQIVIMVGSGGG